MFNLLFVFLSLLVSFHAYYLPGLAPHDYKQGETVELFVNALSASDNLLSYDYYYPAFHFCQPNSIIAQRESLGAILFGDRLYNSPFKVSFPSFFFSLYYFL
jgi:transmembrane 9 superfamily protein 2/4